MNKKTDAVLDLADVPNCIYINSQNQIRRLGSEAIRRLALNKYKLGRPVGSCPEGTDVTLKHFCCANSFDTLIIICTDGWLVAVPALRIPSSKIRDKKGNHPYETLLPELQGRKIGTMMGVNDADAWESKLLIIGT